MHFAFFKVAYGYSLSMSVLLYVFLIGPYNNILRYKKNLRNKFIRNHFKGLDFPMAL